MAKYLSAWALLWLSAPAGAQLQFAPDSLVFGQAPVPSGKALQVLLRNEGLDPVLIDRIAVRGSGYELPAPPLTGAALLLAPAASLPLVVRFAPAGPGPHRAELVAGSGPDSALLVLEGEATRVRIDEILADPPADLLGDANGDGMRDTYADEFIELFNAGPDTVSLAGWRLGDDDATPTRTFTFPPEARIAPAGRVVLFGGGAPVGFSVPVFVDDGRIGDGLGNSGDLVLLIDADGDTAEVVAGAAWDNDQSLVRFPSGEGEFVAHASPPGNGAPFSPGRARTLADSSAPAPQAPPQESPPARIAINEILADPPADLAGDANGDGTRDTYADEFIELFNAGPDTVSLAGWRLGDDDVASAGLFQFPAGARLAPGGYLLLFGGGAPVGFSVPVFVDDGRIGDGLGNSGDTLLLLDAEGDTVDVAAGDGWPADRSLARWPEGQGAFTPHDTPPGSGEPFSPGRARALLAPADTSAPPPAAQPRQPRPSHQLLITEILADPPGDANGDGRADREEDEFVELFNAGPSLDLSGWRLSDDDTSPGRQFRFPAGAILNTGEYLVLFGGGVPRALPGLVFADDGRLGDGLGNTGDRLLLLAGEPPDTLIDFTYVSHADLNQSLSCPPGGVCAPHSLLPGRGLFSPGQDQPRYTRFSLDILTLVAGQTDTLVLRGHYPGGTEPPDPSQVRWHVEDRRILQVDRDGIARGLLPGRTIVDAWTLTLFLASVPVQVEAPPPPPPPPNQPPRFASIPDTIAYAGGHYHYLLRAEDPERASLVYSLIQAPDWLRLDPDTHLLFGQAPPQASGEAQVLIEIDDGRGGLAVQCYTIRLLPPPRLLITEVLADPPSGLAGDANGDGQRHTYGDEFIELYNPEPQPVDLGGWLLRGASGELFRFPAQTLLPAGSYAVVFAGSAPPLPLSFSAGGRLGRGLGNRQDSLCLIDPSGPDTLIRIGYCLERDPNQALCWAPDSASPALHSHWPGRDLFSPGRPRPLLQGLSLEPPFLRLAIGERAPLKLVGRFSDGQQQELRLPALWRSAAPAIASLQGTVVVARDTGQTRIWAQLDTFAAGCQVKVRPPLARRLDFSPDREQLAASPGRLVSFAVRSLEGEELACRWSVNRRLRESRALRLMHPAPARGTDTVQVEVRARHEVHTHRWLLRSSAPLPSPAALPRPRNHPNPFNSSTHIHFYLPSPGLDAAVRICDLTGQRVRQLAVPPAAEGWHTVAWDSLDDHGRPAASGVYFYLVQCGTSCQAGKLLLLR